MSVLAVRHVSAGSVYTLVTKGLGPGGGVVATTALFLNMAISGPFLAIGLGLFFSQFLVQAGVIASGSYALDVAIALVGLLLVSAIAYLDIRISTRLLLAIEFASISLITVLLLIVIARQGVILDHAQLTLHGFGGRGMMLAIVLCVLSFGGFESSASLGLEARNPQRGVRMTVIGAVVLTGLFFVFNSYAQVLGFKGTGLSIASQSAPLSALANHYGVSWLGDIVLLFVAFSFFGCLNAWMNYLARIGFAAGCDGVIPRVFGKVHPRTRSPYVAIVSWAVVWFLLSAWVFAADGTTLGLNNAFANLGAFSGFCWTLTYLLAALAAPAYFLRRHIRSITVLIAGLIGAVVMGIEFYYSFDPLPSGTLALYVYVFAGTAGSALVGSLLAYKLAPRWFGRVGKMEDSPDAIASSPVVPA